MSSTVRQGDTLVFVGDSLTALGWMDEAVADIQAAIPQRYVGAASVSDGTRGSVVGTPGTFTPIPYDAIVAVNSGVGQNRVANIEADITGRILQYGPTHVIVEVGRNDVNPPVAPFTPTTLVAFRASLDNILDTVLAADPTISITCLSIFTSGELWITSGGQPAWNNYFDPTPGSSYTPSIAEFDAQIQASCVAHGGTYIDLRGPALAYEAIHNVPEPGTATGTLTVDGTHPNAAGETMMSDLYMATVTVVP